MQQIINFLIKNKNHLLYLLLFLIALIFTVQSHSFHRTKFMNSANAVSGNLYASTNDISSYFRLRKENNKLLEENRRLRHLLFNTKQIDTTKIDSTTYFYNYDVFAAKATNNTYSKSNNFITIDAGKKDSISQDMGVITAKGILGIIDYVSNGHATVQSILNTKSNINAKIKNTNYFGTLNWDTKAPNIIQLIDIERFVPVKKGDTIITGGKSTIFPEGVPIGTIADYKLNKSNNAFNIDVKLFNDMTNIGYVYIIKNKNKAEILTLEEKAEDEY